MSFATVSKKKEDVQSGGGGNVIFKTGMYDVDITAAFVSTHTDKSKKGEVVDLFVDYNDKPQVLYGNMRTTNNDGKSNDIGRKLFNQLMVVAGLEDVDVPQEFELPIGKGGAMKSCMVLEDVTDIPVTISIQLEYSTFNGNIQERKTIKGFYRTEDKASAEEIVNEVEPGSQYAKDVEYYGSNTKYSDDLSPEKVDQWIKAGRPKGTAGASSTPASKAPAFGKKKFGKS